MKLDITEYHTYSVDWKPASVKYYIDGKLIRTINQSPNYPMQFRIDILEFPQDIKPGTGNDPKEFIIYYVRAYKMKTNAD